MKFRVRLDQREDTREWLSAYLRDKPHVLVHHILPHGNPHFHFYVDLPLVNSVAGYTYQWKKLVDPKGFTRSDWSIKQCSDERKPEFISYLFNTKHGNISELISTTEPVEDARANAATISLAFEERKDNAKKTPAKQITAWDMAEELKDWIDEHADDHEYQLAVIRECIAIHRRHKKTYCVFSIERVIQTALGGSTRQSGLVAQIADKLYKYSQ